MELNTSNENQIPSTTPLSLSQFEDSPVFNYINNLSPIELVKSIHTGQAFNLPSFASPLSVFASPRLPLLQGVNSQSLQNLCSFKVKMITTQGVLEAAKLTGLSVEQSECFTPGNSGKGLLLSQPVSTWN